MSKSYQDITFFYTDSIEKYTTEEIAREAKKRGYRCHFTDDLKTPADIGVYCSHHSDREKKAKLSAIMLHDLGQAHNRWPCFWDKEPWNQFDIGFLPGQFWADMFVSNKSHNLRWASKHGIYLVGWPKADPLFNPNGQFQKELETLKKSLNFKYDKTILYAPSWENDGKQDDFINRLQDQPYNLLIKQADWPINTYPHIVKNIEEMEKKHANTDRLVTLDRRSSIMPALALADVIVSDESSVLIEALLFDCPGIGVEDWIIPDEVPPRMASIPYDFVRKIKKAALKDTVHDILTNGHHVDYRGKSLSMKEYSEHWFAKRGQSSILIMDAIDQLNHEGHVGISDNVCKFPALDGNDPSAIYRYFQYIRARLQKH